MVFWETLALVLQASRAPLMQTFPQGAEAQMYIGEPLHITNLNQLLQPSAAAAADGTEC